MLAGEIVVRTTRSALRASADLLDLRSDVGKARGLVGATANVHGLGPPLPVGHLDHPAAGRINPAAVRDRALCRS